MVKCKYCRSTLSEQSSVCSLCKVNSAKEKKALTKEEKRVAYYCRAIRVTGILSIIGGALGIAFSIGVMVELIVKKANLIVVLLVAVNLLISIAYISVGSALRKYEKWSYIGGALLYTIAIVLAIVTKSIGGILFAILFLSYVASPTSRKILYREL